MGNAANSIVPIGSDGSGQKKVRNLQLEVLQPDGTFATVQMQVVAIVDENGMPYTISNPAASEDDTTHGLLTEIRDLLREMLETLQG
jgi:hypothetical protein